ncbi:hypothetical protein OG369_39380 [Streptomyces sp. NBC_01221]|uniref:hypothetical protein n=1 Tax=Streptomyces sp. NBC_01221 TaxID=2903782 RepID=UPI00224E3ACD|nr:hypothetical protein [Streptomyces sp. NBC_01221]MCX4791923.1 hypothetical protein [Streptomyces sp. NBC_01221]
MADQDDRAVRAQRPDAVVDRFLGTRVERGGRLVADKHTNLNVLGRYSLNPGRRPLRNPDAAGLDEE